MNVHVGWAPNSVMWDLYNRPGHLIAKDDVIFYFGVLNAGLKRAFTLSDYEPYN